MGLEYQKWVDGLSCEGLELMPIDVIIETVEPSLRTAIGKWHEIERPPLIVREIEQMVEGDVD